MSKKSNQDDSEEFKRLEALWERLFKRIIEYQDDWDEYKKLQPMWAGLFNRMRQRIHELGDTYQQKMRALEGQVQNKQEEIQRLQISWNELDDANKQLKTAYNEILSELAKLRRDTTSVYTSGVTAQVPEERVWTKLVD